MSILRTDGETTRMTEEQREILSAGRECFSALSEAADIFERSKRHQVPKRVRQALERTRPILFGEHLKEEKKSTPTIMISGDPGYYD
jgi:hypothetical protein